MPELDGIAALPLLLKKKPTLMVIMASALTRRSAEVSLRALSLGAADYVPKPGAATDAGILAAFQHELIEKIRNLGSRLLARQGRAGAIASRPLLAPRLREGVPLQAEAPAFSLRPFAHCLPRVLLIGSSTGGPQALTILIGQLGAAIERAPILITQHMPPTFTTVLAEHLARSSSRRVLEARRDIVRGLLRRRPEIDFEAGELHGLTDRAVLELAAREGRLLVTHDIRTIPALYASLRGNTEPQPAAIERPSG